MPVSRHQHVLKYYATLLIHNPSLTLLPWPLFILRKYMHSAHWPVLLDHSNKGAIRSFTSLGKTSFCSGKRHGLSRRVWAPPTFRKRRRVLGFFVCVRCFSLNPSEQEATNANDNTGRVWCQTIQWSPSITDDEASVFGA